jgi:hypothetical protein
MIRPRRRVITCAHRRYVGEWTATATDAEGRAIEWDGIDVFPFRDGLIARKDVYSGSHAPHVL